MSHYDSNFTIEAHLGASCFDFMENSLRGHSTNLASRVNAGATQSFEVQFGFQLHYSGTFES